MGGAEHVVSDPKLAGRKHLFAVLIVGKCARLANQRINDVAIIDRRQFLADQSRHRLNDVALVRHHDFFCSDSQIDSLTNQPTGNRICIRPHMNRAALADANPGKCIIRVKPFVREWSQLTLLFRESRGTMRVCPDNDVFRKPDVFIAAVELTTSAEHQRLIETLLEMPIQRFDIAVLVGAPGIRAFAFAAVVVQQCRIAIGENSAIRVISYGRTQRIGAMPLRDTAEFQKCFLNAVTERFKRFRKTQ